VAIGGPARRCAAHGSARVTAPSPGAPADGEQRARKGRYALYLLGGFFAALGIALEMVPLFASVTPVRVAKGCALLGAVILAVGRFSPDAFVRRFAK
jgi:hypothetical protein